MRIGLLVCGHVNDALLGFGGDYPELFASYLAPWQIEVHPFFVDVGELPESVEDRDAWIVSPSRSSVLDRPAWLNALNDFVRAAVEAERPLAGICFGHQVLAEAFGGRVERAGIGWGAGVQRYEVVEHQWWMDPRAAHFNLVASHEDQVMELPPDGRLLASAPYCPNAMFAIGERAIGLQPHPELTTAMSRTLIGIRHDLLGAAVATAATASLTTTVHQDLIGRWLGRFLSSRC